MKCIYLLDVKQQKKRTKFQKPGTTNKNIPKCFYLYYKTIVKRRN